MSARRHLVALAALALPLLLAPIGLALTSGPSDTLEGTLEVWHGDTSTQPTALGAGIRTASGLVPLKQGASAAVQALAGQNVRAHGKRGSTVFDASGGVQPAGGTTTAAVGGTKSVAVLLFNFANDSRQPWTTSHVRGVVFDNAGSVNAYYQDVSYGQLSLTGDVFGWYTIDATNEGCAYSTWASQARTKATAAGVALSNYQYVVYAFPQTSSCGWAGLAYLPGTGSWINGAMSLRVVGHELGHNFGVHHASTLSCTAGGVRSTFGSSCSQSEYGDPFTIMGSASTRHHVNWHRSQLGWAGDVQTITATGSYTLAAAPMSGTPRLLRVARGDGTYLNLELRKPWGTFDSFSTSDPAVNGVTIRIAPNTTSIVQSKLVDANPSTTSFSDAALGVGQSVTDPLTGVSITTVSVGSSSAVVSVQFVPDSQAPSAPGALSATVGTTSVLLGWAAATDNVGVAGYRVYRNGTQVGTTASTSYTDPGLQPSTSYAYEVRAYDTSGNLGPASSRMVTTLALDTEPPTAPANLKATVQKGRKVALTWSASTDNVGVAGYDVYRNGTKVASAGGTSYTDRPGRGTFTYTVRARDAAGNVSGDSNTVTAKT